MNQNVIFWVQSFSKIVLFENNFLFKIELSKNLFFFKIMLSKTLFFFKIKRVVIFLIQNHAFYIVFSDSRWFIIKVVPTSKTACLKMTMAWAKKIFYECVACVCLMFGTLFLVIAFFIALGFSVGLMTISFALLIDLHKSLWNSKNG